MGNEKTFPDSFNEILKTIETQTATFFEGVADSLLGKAETLRDGTEFNEVELPRDLYAHSNAQTEWWYYTGHFQTDPGKKTSVLNSSFSNAVLISINSVWFRCGF